MDDICAMASGAYADSSPESQIPGDIENPGGSSESCRADEGEGLSGTPSQTAPKNAFKQRKSENSAYAAARRCAQAKAKAAEEENLRLREALQKLLAGSCADSPASSPADPSLPEASELTDEQLPLSPDAEDIAGISPLVSALQEQLSAYIKRDMERTFSDDLAAVKRFYPTEKAESVEALGPTFIRARAMGLDPVSAYDIAQAHKSRTQKPAPPELGAVSNTAGAEKEFYSPSEVDKLSERELNNPRIIQRVIKSMQKWK